jgi:hypothetical protein
MSVLRSELTESERRFEDYCTGRGYVFHRIVLPPTEGRRPDYRVVFPAGPAIVEVKQIEPGPWELTIDERMKEHGRADFSRPIGNRARALIRDAAPQLKRFATENIPCLIFALDLTWHTHLSDVDVDAAMFGHPLVRFHQERKDPDEWRSDFGHGGGRQMTNGSRRYVSAIAVMDKKDDAVVVYHNPFAVCPLFPRYLPHSADRHFIKGDHPERAGHLWLEFTGPRV